METRRWWTSSWEVADIAHEWLGLKWSELRLVVRGVMVIAWAITNLQKWLGLGHGLASLAQVGLWGFRDERRGEDGSILFDIRTRELQWSIYSLYMRRWKWGDDWEGRWATYSTKVKLRMSKYLLSWDQGRVGLGIRSLNVKGKDARDVRQTGTYECWVDARTKNYLNTVGMRRRRTLTKGEQVVSVLALLACLLGFCWKSCTRSCPFVCNCVGVVCIFGRRESWVVAVVTPGVYIRFIQDL